MSLPGAVWVNGVIREPSPAMANRFARGWFGHEPKITRKFLWLF